MSENCAVVTGKKSGKKESLGFRPSRKTVCIGGRRIIGAIICLVFTGLLCTGSSYAQVIEPNVPAPGDYDVDGDVDLTDFARIAFYWQQNCNDLTVGFEDCNMVDIAPAPHGDMKIGVEDLFRFACFWLSLGGVEPMPECWNWPYQCLGNADGITNIDGARTVWVSGGTMYDGEPPYADGLILEAAWQTSYGDADYDPCADFNRDGHVNDDDMFIYLNWLWDGVWSFPSPDPCDPDTRNDVWPPNVKPD